MSQGPKQINPKSSLLWNVVDPDDPYDIRKSMIARLPDHTQNFMGGNLQIVCLMQAAQIERLNTYLSQFRLRYRELERKELDRHSYQIQIKQLSQKSNEVSKLRIDNQKLRDYIKKQTIQLQELTRRPNVPESFQTEHEELFKRYQSLLSQLQNSRETINSQTLTLNKSIEQNKELRIKYDRLDKQRLTEITQEREKYELKIRERIQMEIKQVEHKCSSKIYQLESDCRLYKQQLESKNHQISSLMSRNQSLRRQLENKQKQAQTVTQYEEKVKQLQSLNFNLSRKAEEFERNFEQYTKLENQLRDVQKAFYDSQQKNRFYRTEIDRLNQSKKDDSFKDVRIIQLQNKSALLSQEIQRLTLVIENKNRDAQQMEGKANSVRIEYETKLKQLTFQYEQKILNAKQNQEKIDALQAELRPLRTLTIELKLKNQLLMKDVSSSTAYQHKYQELQGELKKANTIITDKNNLILNLEARLKSGEASSFQMTSIKNSYMQTTRMLKNVQMILSSYSGRPSEGASNEDIIKNILKELEKKKELREELERQVHATHQLRNALKETQKILTENNELINRLRKQINDIKNLNQQYEADIKKGNLISFNVMDVEIRRNVEETRKKLQLQFQRDFRKNLEDRAILERSNSELSHQKRMLQQQITVLREKIERKNIEVDQSYANIETRYMNQVHDLSNSLKAVREQNERLTNEKNKLKNSLTDFQREIGMKQKQQSQMIKDINKRCEELRINNDELKRENNHLRQGIAEAQDTAFRSQREIEERLIKIYTSQLQDKDNIISSLQRQVKVSREEIKSLQTASENSGSSLKNYRDRLLMVSQEIERLNEILTNKNKQIDGLKSQLGSIEPAFKKQLADRDEQIKRIKSKVEDVDVTIRRETQVKQQEIRGLKGHIQYLDAEMRKKIGQKEQLQEQYRTLRSRFENMEIVLRKQINERQSQIRMMITQLEAGDPNSKRQLIEKDNQLNSLRNQLNNFKSAYTNLEQEMGKLKFQINVMQQEHQSRSRERQLRIRQEVGEELVKLTQDNGKLNSYISNLQENIRVYADNQKIYTKRLGDLEARNNSTEYQLKGLSEEYNRILAKSNEYQRTVQELSTNIYHLDSTIQQQQRTIYQFEAESAARQGNERKIMEQDIEIRNLKQMLKQMQDINIHTIAERDQLLRIQSQLQAQIHRLSSRFREEDSKDAALAQLKNKYNQISAICAQYQHRIKDYEEKFEAFIKTLNQHQQIFQRTDAQIAYFKNLLMKKDNQLANLQHEISQGGELKNLLHDRDQQIRKLLEILEGNKRTLVARETELNQLNGKIREMESKIRAIAQLEARCQENDIQIRNMRQMLQQMEEINLHTVAERDQLFQLSHEYKDEINQLKLSLQSNQKKVSEAMFLDIKNAYHSLQTEYISLQDKTKRYQSSIEVLGRKNQQYEAKLRQLMGENDRLRLIIIERQKNLGNVNQLLERISELQIECTNKSEEAKEWEQKYVPLYNAYKSESEVSKNKILEYQRKITALDQQFEQINSLLRSTRQENEQLKAKLISYEDLIQKNRLLGEEIDRLNIVINNLKQDLSDTRLRLTDQMALEKRVQEYMSLMVILFAEIQTLRNRVSQTELECENVRRSSLTPHRVDRQVGRSLDSRDKTVR